MTRRILAAALAILLCAFMHRAPSTSDPGATRETQELYIYLRDIGTRSTHNVIVGQHVGSAACCTTSELQPAGYNANWTGLYTATGYYPGLLGIDVNDYNNSLPGQPVDYSTLIAEVESAYAAGSVIEVSWHASDPFTGGKWSDAASGTSCNGTGNSLSDIANTNTTVYATWHAHIAAIAKVLLSLRDANGNLIPVIWRPFLESNNSNSTGWWWAGACNSTFSQQVLRTIWLDLYNSMAAMGVHNLLWTYSASLPATVNGDPYAMYPGGDVVDLVGLDNYRDATAPTPYTTFPEYTNLCVQTEKPCVYSERGPQETDGTSQVFANVLPGIESNATSPGRPAVSSLMAWFGANSIVSNPGAETLMSDSHAATQTDTARFWNCARQIAVYTYAAVEACVTR